MPLKNNFEYLIQEMECKKNKYKIFDIVEKLIANDPFQKTEFEYSLQIEKSQIINNLRIVNFDTYYLPNEENLYLVRLNLVKSIALSYCGKNLLL
jgi:ribosome biogenesis protein Nip4